MKIFRKIKLFLRTVSEYGLSPIQIEIKRTEVALRRHRWRLEDYHEDFDSTRDCCEMCAYGWPYQELIKKIERVEARLEQLRARLQRNNSSQ